MNQQLAFPLQLSHPATLLDFFWGDNTHLQQQLELTLNQGGEPFLYLWGDTGSGKSHLLEGACQAMGLKNQSAAYVPLKLLQEWGPISIEDIEKNSLIAIDDIDAIAGDKAWEEALFHLYNRIRDNGKTILLIAGKTNPLASNIQLADLCSRLSLALIFQLSELHDDLKHMALQQRAQKRGYKLSHKAAFFLINRSKRNMHDLYQILDRLDEASLVAQRKITVPFIKDVLGI